MRFGGMSCLDLGATDELNLPNAREVREAHSYTEVQEHATPLGL
jgi:hypothetical protein